LQFFLDLPNSPVGIHIQHTKWGVGIALLFVTLPFVVRSVQPVLLELDREVEEAAASLGANNRTIFTLVIIPALNEAASIGSVVAAARAALPAAVVLVIDDGSTDETASAAAAAGAEILRLPFNCGIGAAVQAGLRFAIEHRAGLIARLDADGQHDPADLGTLAATIEQGADYVIGSRFCDAGQPGYRSSFTRRIGIRWFAALLRLDGLPRPRSKARRSRRPCSPPSIGSTSRATSEIRPTRP